MRAGIAAATAAALVLEALAAGLVNWVLGLAARHQEMRLGGAGADALAAGAWAAGGLLAAYLLLCAVLVARAAWRARTPGRVARAVLVVCAVGQGLAGALVVGLVGWWAFAVLMAVLGLLVGTLLLYAPQAAPGKTPPPVPPGAPVTSTGP